jgi:hypothetical protein
MSSVTREDPDFIQFLRRYLPPDIAELGFTIVQLAMVREEIALLGPNYICSDAEAMDKVRAIALRVAAV